MLRLSILAGVVLLAMVGCGGGGDDDASTVAVGPCEECWTLDDVEVCRNVCEGRENCECPVCDDGLICALTLGTRNDFRCAVNDTEVRTCCNGSRWVDCDTGEPI